MILPWIVAVAALAVAVAAWLRSRRNTQRLEQLSQMYWELKYQHGELRSQLSPRAAQVPPPPRPAQRSAATDAFVPLASLKR